MDEMDHLMNRCPALYDRANEYTRCFRDANHDGQHLRYGDPAKPPIEWTAPVVISLVDRIIGRIGL